ncbi:MAG: signal protein PDZ [Rhodospirillales bacterium CG15_BIG_FIL_POST_REV_8_21_14_020_66_15]|nr:MAG: signal protein PDZ [Rhodospirillales bacterium CG15_BIG_FIL_POST_REV_8_21_14_020_66_15]
MDDPRQDYPEIPEPYRPDEGRFSFDVDEALQSVVSLRSEIPDAAFTAGTLGTARSGHGVVIDSRGLVLTIGYLIVEADHVWLVSNDGRAVEGYVMGYDQETGFGLVQALQPLDAPAIGLGSSADLIPGDDVIVAGWGGRAHALQARVSARKEFAGYWEYLLDDAIFTTPAHPLWGGAALIGEDGTLRGIGSLYVRGEESGETEGNMIVPIDIVKAILPTLRATGDSGRPPRPWLGTFTAEAMGRVVIVGTWRGGPAENAGLVAGDLVVGVDDKPVEGMAEFFRGVWSLGPAGIDVPLNIYRDGDLMTITVRSRARGEFYRSPNVH